MEVQSSVCPASQGEEGDLPVIYKRDHFVESGGGHIGHDGIELAEYLRPDVKSCGRHARRFKQGRDAACCEAPASSA
jgi:hypothetical protein